MSVYTVHAPPPQNAGASPDPERFSFVRDGFSPWAFLVAALWMLWHRMWLMLLIYVVVLTGLQLAMRYAGVPTALIIIVSLLLSLIVALEASTLRRLALARRGWNNLGIVSGEDLEDAERRFFDGWVRKTPTQSAAVPATSASAPLDVPMRQMPRSSDVIGLFPEPGENG